MGCNTSTCMYIECGQVSYASLQVIRLPIIAYLGSVAAYYFCWLEQHFKNIQPTLCTDMKPRHVCLAMAIGVKIFAIHYRNAFRASSYIIFAISFLLDYSARTMCGQGEGFNRRLAMT